MLDIIEGLKNWTSEPKQIALATVTKTWGSAPRKVGSAMAISEDMEMLGSVSGGCIEGAVIQEAKEIMKSGTPRQLSFGVSDEDAWEVGLSCGGEIHVFVEPFLTDGNTQHEHIWKGIQQAIEGNTGAVWLSNMKTTTPQHLLVLPNGNAIGDNTDPALVEAAIMAFNQRKNQVITLGEMPWFAHVFPRKNQIIIIGATHITAHLVDLAHQFGFETIVIDPRGLFAQKTQFSVNPHQVYEQWPEEILHEFYFDAYTFAVTLTHDAKIDDQALQILLKSDVAYIGALGGKKTHKKRIQRLKDAGFEEETIARIHAPVGLNIGAQSAQEIALSILAEIIKVKNAHL